MIIVSVMYPPSARFDLDYYTKKHISMVKSRCEGRGLSGAYVLKGDMAAGGGAPPYQVIGHLTFDNLQNFQAVMAQHGTEIMADIPNYTDSQPIIQISTVVG
jgi:uncharacterized protein (TIGR02118 family)